MYCNDKNGPAKQPNHEENHILGRESMFDISIHCWPWDPWGLGAGKINCIYVAIFHGYVKLPEGMFFILSHLFFKGFFPFFPVVLSFLLWKPWHSLEVLLMKPSGIDINYSRQSLWKKKMCWENVATIQYHTQQWDPEDIRVYGLFATTRSHSDDVGVQQSQY